MKIKKKYKRRLYLILFIAIVALTTYFGFKVKDDYYINELINERNTYCANLTFQLAGLGQNCYCYFEGFRVGDAEVDDNSMPLCACECIINGTPVRIGLITS